jgi:hypothetical protein
MKTSKISLTPLPVPRLLIFKQNFGEKKIGMTYCNKGHTRGEGRGNKGVERIGFVI